MLRAIITDSEKSIFVSIRKDGKALDGRSKIIKEFKKLTGVTPNGKFELSKELFNLVSVRNELLLMGCEIMTNEEYAEECRIVALGRKASKEVKEVVEVVEVKEVKEVVEVVKDIIIQIDAKMNGITLDLVDRYILRFEEFKTLVKINDGVAFNYLESLGGMHDCSVFDCGWGYRLIYPRLMYSDVNTLMDAYKCLITNIMPIKGIYNNTDLKTLYEPMAFDEFNEFNSNSLGHAKLYLNQLMNIHSKKVSWVYKPGGIYKVYNHIKEEFTMYNSILDAYVGISDILNY